MLALTRETNESVYIGNIRVMIVRVSGNKVRLGIEAPAEVKILREELVGRPRRDAYVGRRAQVSRRAVAVV